MAHGICWDMVCDMWGILWNMREKTGKMVIMVMASVLVVIRVVAVMM